MLKIKKKHKNDIGYHNICNLYTLIIKLNNSVCHVEN